MSRYKHPFIPWIILGGILLALVIWIGPTIFDQMKYGDDCARAGGVFTFNGVCVEEIEIKRD